MRCGLPRFRGLVPIVNKLQTNCRVKGDMIQRT
jgi:hypothetical protein